MTPHLKHPLRVPSVLLGLWVYLRSGRFGRSAVTYCLRPMKQFLLWLAVVLAACCGTSL